MQQINSINQVDIQYQMITFATLSIFIYLRVNTCVLLIKGATLTFLCPKKLSASG